MRAFKSLALRPHLRHKRGQFLEGMYDLVKQNATGDSTSAIAIYYVSCSYTRHYQWYITLSYKPLIYRYGIFHTLRIRHTMCYEIIIILRIKLL